MTKSRAAMGRRMLEVATLLCSFQAGKNFGAVERKIDSPRGDGAFNGTESSVQRLRDEKTRLEVEIRSLKLELAAVRGDLLSSDTTRVDGTGPSEPTAAVEIAMDVPLPLAHPQWCPNAKCHNTDLCHPCQDRFLIVVTTPRSASTTLTWMLDELPGIRMAGENGYLLNDLQTMEERSVEVPQFRNSVDKKTAFGHNFVPDQSFSCVSQSAIRMANPPLLQNNGTRIADPVPSRQEIIGFKTIKFFHRDDREIHDKAEWIKERFPCSRIVINYNSDLDQRERSESALNNFYGNRTKYVEDNEKLILFHELLGPEQSFLLDKTNWTQDIGQLNDLVTWLGFDRACHFRELLQYNIGGFSHNKTTFSQGRDARCRRLRWED